MVVDDTEQKERWYQGFNKKTAMSTMLYTEGWFRMMNQALR